MITTCTRCGECPPIPKERYCPVCRGAVLDELRETASLDDEEIKRLSRKEDRPHKKLDGDFNGSWDNAVRIVEES